MGIQSFPSNAASNASGLRAAVRILERWGMTQHGMVRVLRVSRSSISRAKSNFDSIGLDDDQLDRISYVLNIHAALRALFENPDNVYGFMSLKNHNEFFNGRSPLEVINSGHYVALYETFKRIDWLHGGMW